MYQRKDYLRNATLRQLRKWQRMFDVQTDEHTEIEDEIQWREYAHIYGCIAASQMMDSFVTARNVYENKRLHDKMNDFEQGNIFNSEHDDELGGLN